MSFEAAAPDASLGIGANSMDADSYTAVRLVNRIDSRTHSNVDSYLETRNSVTSIYNDSPLFHWAHTGRLVEAEKAS
jgi:hypothetical protein